MDDAGLADYVEQREALLAVIREVLVGDLRVALPPEQIDPDTPLFATGLALDSIDAVDLVVALERKTGVRINDDEAGRLGLRSVNMVINYLLAAQERLP